MPLMPLQAYHLFSNFSEWGHPPSFSHWILSKIGCRSVVSRMKFYYFDTFMSFNLHMCKQIVEMFRFSALCTSSQKVYFSNIPLLYTMELSLKSDMTIFVTDRATKIVIVHINETTENPLNRYAIVLFTG